MIKRLLLAACLLLGGMAFGQVQHTFPATDTNNTMTGQNTFQNVTCFGSFCMDANGNATTQFSSIVQQGTAPFSVSSTTMVPNLNVALLQGCSWSLPCALGTTVPNSGFFTDLHAQSLTLTGNGGINAQGRWFSVNITNNNSTGTALNKLVTLDGTGNAITAADGQTSGVIGPCVSNCGTTGQAEVAVLGFTTLVSDNAVSNGDWLIAGTSGQVHDVGTTRPSGGQVVGRAQGAQPTPGQTFQGLINPDAVGSGSSNTYTLNGILYGNGTTAIQVTAAGGGGTQCLVETGGGTPAWGSCAGSAATSWSALTNPSGNLALSMGAFTTLFTYGNATGAGVDMFKFTDTTSNTGTGHIFRVSLANGSAAKPAAFDVNGNGVEVSNSGVLAKLGTGSVLADATSLNINTTSPLGGGGLFNTNLTLTCTTCVTSGSSLANHQVMLGVGGQGAKTLASIGSSGQVLQSQGAGADPIWATIGGTGTVTNTGGNLGSAFPVYGNGGADVYTSPTTYEVTNFAGADICAKVNAAITAAMAAGQNGATIDARGVTTGLTCAANPYPTETRTAATRAAINDNVTVLWPCQSISTNVQILQPSGANQSLGCESFNGSSAVSTEFKAGSSFPTSGCNTADANGICAVWIMGSADKNAASVILKDIQINGNSKANVWGVYSAQLQERSLMQNLHIQNTGTTASPGGCIYLDKAYGNSVAGAGSSNFVIRDIECDPASSGATSTFKGIYFKIQAGGTGGPAEISNVTIQGNGNSTCGSGTQPCMDVLAGVDLSGGSWGRINHIHCEWCNDAVRIGNTTDNVNTGGIYLTDISISNSGNNSVKANAVHFTTKATSGLAHSLNVSGGANICTVLDDIAGVQTCNIPHQDVWAAGGGTDNGLAIILGGPNDASVSRTAPSKVAVGNGTVGDNSGTLDTTTITQQGLTTTYNGQATQSGGLVADYAAIASGTKSAAIASSPILNPIPNNASFGGIWMVPYYINVTTACTSGCSGATVIPHVTFTDNDTSSSFTVDGPACSLVSTGACSGTIPIFPKVNTAVNYTTTIGGSGPPAGYVYQIRLRLLKP